MERGDSNVTKSFEGSISEVVDRIIQHRELTTSAQTTTASITSKVHIIEHQGINKERLKPDPCFHGRRVPMNSGFVWLKDIQLWNDNKRLDIPLEQFRQTMDREPSSEELLDIMYSNMSLPGMKDLPGLSTTEKDDLFEIRKLANSIAFNGVQKPPIIDIDGTLLDGNRRVAACYYIFNHPKKFGLEARKRVENIFVWQLTEYATGDDREAIIVALNFEDDCKLKWPEYVKARKINEAWQTMLSLEPRSPSSTRLKEMKLELSENFGYGRNTSVISRYLKMMQVADEYEDFLIEEKGEDEYVSQHSANRYFQYFDELSKGPNPGGVAHTLGLDESLKHLVFELLHQGKFKNWNLIRSLRYCDQDTFDSLVRAREQIDLDDAQDLVENTLNDAKNRSRQEKREKNLLGVNDKIEKFVNFLENLEVGDYINVIRPEKLQKLRNALMVVDKMIEAIQQVNSSKG